MARPSAAGRLAAIAAFVIAAAVAAWWWWSPHLALRQMQAAAQARDAAALNRQVDYPKLRESIKGQLAARLGEKMQGARDNPVAAFGMSIGLMLAGGMVDALVRPEVLMQAFETGRMQPAPAGGTQPREAPPPSAPSGDDEDGRPRWTLERDGANRVLAYPVRDGRADHARVGFVLERSGFAHWTLTGVRLPAF